MKTPRSIPLVLLSLFGLLSLCIGQNSPRYVGKEACATCHEYEQQMTAGTPHEQGKGCEGCHGPGEKHVQFNGDPSKIFRFKKASAAQVRERCSQCHRNALMMQSVPAAVTCTSCHSPHHYLRKKNLLKESHLSPHDSENT